MGKWENIWSQYSVIFNLEHHPGIINLISNFFVFKNISCISFNDGEKPEILRNFWYDPKKFTVDDRYICTMTPVL